MKITITINKEEKRKAKEIISAADIDIGAHDYVEAIKRNCDLDVSTKSGIWSASRRHTEDGSEVYTFDLGIKLVEFIICKLCGFVNICRTISGIFTSIAVELKNLIPKDEIKVKIDGMSEDEFNLKNRQQQLVEEMQEFLSKHPDQKSKELIVRMCNSFAGAKSSEDLSNESDNSNSHMAPINE